MQRGFTLIEVLIALALLAIVATVAVPVYSNYVDRSRQADAIAGMMEIAMELERFESLNFAFPDSLAEIGKDGLRDPWGNPYQYLRIAGAGNVQGQVRKDKNLNPINNDFDLYSSGPDGASVSPLTAPASRDDIVRAGNGNFYGVAEAF